MSLGTMMFGAWGNRDLDACRAILDEALDAGINLVDTADIYSFGEAEETLGACLGARRDEVVLASKVNNAMTTERNHGGNSRRWIVREVESSLRRLRTDHLDLYQIHRPDPSTDLDETLAALSDLVRQGKVLSIGTSTFPASLLVESQWVAERRGRERFATEQPPYSILARGIEAEVLPVCQQFGLGVLVWAPLNGGWLTGKYRRGAAPPAGSRAAREPDHIDVGDPVAEAKYAATEALSAIADQAGLTLAHLGLAFTLSHPTVTSAIIGPRTVEQLRDVLAAADLTLTDDVLDAIDGVVAPGTTLNPRDRGWDSPALTDPRARRR